MSESGSTQDTRPMHGPGAMIRAARQAQGLHIATLATMLKVSPRKLEALEADRFEELQGLTFVRALAQAACRSLKMDPAPVLARLPAVDHRTLDQVNGGLNAPFREHGARRDVRDFPALGQGALLAAVVLMVGAAALWFLPAQWKWAMPDWNLTGLVARATSAVTVQASPASSARPAVADHASVEATSLGATNAQVVAGDATAKGEDEGVDPVILLQVRARNESWVEVIDGTGQSLTSRTLHPGEVVDMDGSLPLRVKIGNASGTELSFRGQQLDLASHTRDNVARLELR